MNEADELIDVHTHVVPERFPAYLGRDAGVRWPSTAPAHACHRHVMIGGSVYRTVSHQCWDCAMRRADMARRRVTRQVLSPMPELLSYGLSPDDGAALGRYLNETIAAMVAEAPDRFSGLAAVPLQDVARAIDELDHALHRLGLAGAEIGTNVLGVPIGAAQFAPFFEAAAAWGAAIFVHPLRPAGMERLVGPPALEQVVAFPGETGLAAASLITAGVLQRLPALRIALSHGGGTLAALLPRLRHGWRAVPPVRDAIAVDPLATARQFYLDDLVYDARAIEHLIEVFGPTQLMVGTDYPFVIMDDEPAERVESLAIDDATRRALLAGNARRWLGLAPASKTD